MLNQDIKGKSEVDFTTILAKALTVLLFTA